MDEKNIKAPVEQLAEDAKDYKEGRFDFALFINDNLVCKRNFIVYNFIEGSMQSEDFRYTMEDIVRMIQDDLKSKSRVYTWYYFDDRQPILNEFIEPIAPEWEATFKLVVYDNKKEVYTHIWDGGCYPSAIRYNVDMTNTVVKVITRDGETLFFDKEYFKNNADRLSAEMYVRKAIMGDRPNLLSVITKRICETCSSWSNSPYENISDYNTTMTFGKGENAKTYNLLINQENKKFFKSWEKAVEAKTKAYFMHKK